MKHPVKAIVALLLFMAVSVAQVGYAQTIRNSSNSMIAKIESDGTVRNSSNSYIGKIYSDGDIRDSSNHLIGKISSSGEVRDSNNSFIGKIESDGTVRNRSNSYVGKVCSDGTVAMGLSGTAATASLATPRMSPCSMPPCISSSTSSETGPQPSTINLSFESC